MTIAGLVLAGGSSLRMGHDKAFAPLSGGTMLGKIVERLSGQVGPLAVNANGDPVRFSTLGLPVLPDDKPDTGPLAGILAGMRWAETLPSRPEFLATVPVDTPFIPDDLVARLDAARGGLRMIVIAGSGDRDHPVIGLWPIALADALAEWRLTARSLGVRGFLAAHGFTVVSFPYVTPGTDPFFNVNSPEQLAEAQLRWDDENLA